jgi:hypothetical protein
MERSLLLFRESIKTKVTFQVYQRRLQEFMRFCNVSSFDELTQVTNLQESLEDYIIEKKQSISPNSVPNYFWPIKTFCESNEIELKWKKIQRFFPSKVKTGGKRPYTTKDIQDPDGLFSSVELSTQEVGDKLELTFDIVFEKPMPKSDILLVAWDFKRDRVQTTLLDAWEVVESGNENGGCLIATATYGSELAPQVQQLRELRDNQLLNTESGSAFMESFNDFYYSFSPYIADYERENPIFKEMVKIAITPMISSLSILNYVDMDSEVEVLGYGISLIVLNIGMYFVAPVVVIVGIRKRFYFPIRLS